MFNCLQMTKYKDNDGAAKSFTKRRTTASFILLPLCRLIYDSNSYNFLSSGSKGEANKNCKIITHNPSTLNVEKSESTGVGKRKRKVNKKLFADYLSTSAKEDSYTSVG